MARASRGEDGSAFGNAKSDHAITLEMATSNSRTRRCNSARSMANRALASFWSTRMRSHARFPQLVGVGGSLAVHLGEHPDLLGEHPDLLCAAPHASNATARNRWRGPTSSVATSTALRIGSGSGAMLVSTH